MSRESADEWSNERVDILIIDQTVVQLVKNGVLDTPEPEACCHPACGKTMRIMSAPPGVLCPAIEPALAAPPTEQMPQEELERRVMESEPPSDSTPSYMLWRTQLPCGHLIHEHCWLLALGARPADGFRTPPACPKCQTPCTDVTSAWWYGVSGTPEDLMLAEGGRSSVPDGGSPMDVEGGIDGDDGTLGLEQPGDAQMTDPTGVALTRSLHTRTGASGPR